MAYRLKPDLALTLFVTRIAAHHIDATFAAHDLAVLADSFNASSDFHLFLTPGPSRWVEAT
jgi:hypothetical protein